MPAPIPPWLQPVDAVGPYLSGVSQGTAIAAQQNQAARAGEALAFQREQAMMEMALGQQKMAMAQQAENRLHETRQLQNQAAAQGIQANATAQAKQLQFDKTLADLTPKIGYVKAFEAAKGFLPASQQVGLAERAMSVDAQNQRMDAMTQRMQSGQQARVQAQQRYSDTMLERNTGETILMPDGSRDPEAYQRAIGKSATLRNTPQERKAELYGEGLKSLYPGIPARDLEEQVAIYKSGGQKAIEAPMEIVKIVDAGDAIVQGLGDAFTAVQKFNAKFGKDAFDQFVGPIEGRLQKLKSKYGNMTKEDEILARQIWSSVAATEQAYRKVNFGTALTQSEIGQFKNIVEDPTSTAFLPTLQSFRNTVENVVKNNLSTRPYAPNIPIEIKKRYAGQKVGMMDQAAPPAAAGSIPAPAARETGKVYDTPKGKLKWTGTGWTQP